MNKQYKIIIVMNVSKSNVYSPSDIEELIKIFNDIHSPQCRITIQKVEEITNASA